MFRSRWRLLASCTVIALAVAVFAALTWPAGAKPTTAKASAPAVATASAVPGRLAVRMPTALTAKRGTYKLGQGNSLRIDLDGKRHLFNAHGREVKSVTMTVYDDSGVQPLLVLNCGVVTCTVYFSRGQSESLYQTWKHNGLHAVIIAACALYAPLSGIAVVVCVVRMTVLTAQIEDGLTAAHNNHWCFAVRYFPITGDVVDAYATNNSRYCRN